VELDLRKMGAISQLFLGTPRFYITLGSVSKQSDNGYTEFIYKITVSSPGTVTQSQSNSVFGGEGAITYSWTYVSGDAFTFASTTTLSPNISHVTLSGDIFHGVYKITATDATGATTSYLIDITAENVG
jgi:hypothetical protein